MMSEYTECHCSSLTCARDLNLGSNAVACHRYFVRPGPDSIWRCHLTSIGNPIVETRRSYNPYLISTMGFPILVRWYLYIESGPWVCLQRPKIFSDDSFEAGHNSLIIWVFSQVAEDLSFKRQMRLIVGFFASHSIVVIVLRNSRTTVISSIFIMSSLRVMISLMFFLTSLTTKVTITAACCSV